MRPIIYTYPPPNHGFVRLDCIGEVSALKGITKEEQRAKEATDIPPRVNITLTKDAGGNVVNLPCTTYEEACELANKIRKQVEAHYQQ